MKKHIIILAIVMLGTVCIARADDNTMSAADSALRQHNWPKAIGLFKSIVSTDTGNLRAWYNLGFSYKNNEQYDSALECFRHVQKSKPDFSGTYLSLAEIYTHQKNFAEAVKSYDDFLQRDSTKPVAHFNRLACLLSLDRRKDAYKEAMLCKSLPLGSELGAKVDEILANLGDRNPHTPPKEFKDDHQLVSCSLPSTWTLKQIDDNKTMQMFISAEKIVKDNDLYTLGCTVTFIRHVSKSVPSMKGKKDSDLAAYWLAVSDTGGMGMLGYKNYFRHKVLSQEDITVNGLPFHKTVRELQLLDGSYIIRSVQLVGASKDNVCTVVYESPADEFDAYSPVFDASIQSLKVSMNAK